MPLSAQVVDRTGQIERLIVSANLDSLQLALKWSKENRSQVLVEKSLNGIIQKYLSDSEISSALSYQLQLEAHYEKYPEPDRQSILFLSMGQNYLYKSLPLKALKYYQLSKSNLDPLQSINVGDRLVEAYMMLGKPDSALVFCDERLDFFRNINNEEEIIKSHKKIAEIYNKIGDYDKALVTNFEIKKIADAREDRFLMATINNNIGSNYNALKNYREALKHFQLAESLDKKSKFLDRSSLFSNIGIVYGNIGDLKNSIRYLLKAEKDLLRNKNKDPLANLYHLISTIYYTNGDVHNALNYSIKSAEFAQKSGDSKSLRDNYLTSALIYQDLYEYDKALNFYQQHLNVRDSLLLEERITKQAISQQQNQLEKSEKEIKLLLANQEVQNLLINQLELEKEKLNFTSEKLKLETARKASELSLLKKDQEVADSKFRNSELIAEQSRQKLILSEQKLINQKAELRLLELKQKEKLAKVELEKNEALRKERDNDIALLQKDKDLLTKDKKLLTSETQINQLKIAQQADFRNTAYSIGGLLSFIGLMFLGGLLNFRRKNRLLGKQKNEIEKQKDEIEISHHLVEKEKSKSDALLLNILPKETATELKESGVAIPKEYEQVSVLFTDFSKFTNLSEGLSAEDLIKELNLHFLAFDEICEKHNIEKIKTIGDSYMCASGLPKENKTHALDIVKAALEMQEFVRLNNIRRKAQDLVPWEMRAGIHSGPIIAGVVGSKKFTYDIWGDTVNTASRMESSGELGQVNISAITYQLVKHKISCTYRGKIEAKNKGEMEMYLVNISAA